MSDKEDVRPVNIDPQCIQEALRMYFQPIKNNDHQLDFYTMYRRETMDYDTEYTRKCNEELNTTLIFAGLFSAVSSAFVIGVQSGLQPDSGERSETYLRAILLSLNPSISPGENPAAPPAWNGPPAEVITSLDLLYASLLVSLFAAFVAMLGKQWLNRYLRHEGSSVIERCGDRQRKCDGLEKWPFRLFIESLPIMLQISLALLACGLSRYMWSVNIPIARVIVSFTILGFLFYVGIVIAGTSSYECPFQTPVSIALRRLRDNWPSFPKITSVVYATQKSARKLLSTLRDTPSQVSQVFTSATQKFTQGIRSLRRGELLPTIRDTNHQPPTTMGGLEPPAPVRNLDIPREQNVGNARCVRWVLRRITDPEAIDSAVCLAGTIQWFNSYNDHDPPYDSIVSIFEACFDSTHRLYPGMRDRAYFAARAILRINAGARGRSHECASKYPIPDISPGSSTHADPDLNHILSVLKCNFGAHQPILDFPTVEGNTHSHLLWVSNLFADLKGCVRFNSVFDSYELYLRVAVVDHQATIYNILLMWCMRLGGEVGEAAHESSSPEHILPHLSARIMRVIADGIDIHCLHFLLEFFSAWENRPECLTRMAYQWCSAIFEVARRRTPNEMLIAIPASLAPLIGLQLRLRLKDLAADKNWALGRVSMAHSREFCRIGPSRNPADPDPTYEWTRYPASDFYAYLLPIVLEVGFRLAGTEPTWRYIPLNHAPHHEWVFEVASSDGDDEIIADAVCMFVMNGVRIPLESFARYFTKRMERSTPFLPRLQRLIMHAIRCIWHRGSKDPGLETIRLLNRLDVEGEVWDDVLEDVIHSPAGLRGLSLDYWRLMLESIGDTWCLEPRDIEAMRLLREVSDWEKLEIWMLVIWGCLPYPSGMVGKSVEEIEEVTFELFSQRRSAIQRFEVLYKPKASENQSYRACKERLQNICNQAQARVPLGGSRTLLQLDSTGPPFPLLFAGDDSF